MPTYEYDGGRAVNTIPVTRDDVKLKPGEWQLECSRCHWRPEPMAACALVCPECRSKDFNFLSENAIPS